MAMDKAEYRRTIGRFATGITVVTTRWGSLSHGMTANSFTSVSLDPTLVLISVENSAYMNELLPRTGFFAASILHAGQEALSRFFATPGHRGVGEFDAIATFECVTGAPILTDALAYVDCRVTATVPAGDHTLYLGEVVAMGQGDEAPPLLYYQGRYRLLVEQ